MAAYKMFRVVVLMSCLSRTAEVEKGLCDQCTFVPSCPQAVRLQRERGKEPVVQWLFQDVLSCKRSHARRISKTKVAGWIDGCLLEFVAETAERITMKVGIDSDDFLEEYICCSKIKKYNLIDLENHPKARLLPENCGLAYSYRIYGGTFADLEEFPWMVVIAYKVKRSIKFKCGGSLITARYVLTASHCVRGRKIAYVRVGDYDLNNSTDCQEKGYCVSNTQNIPIKQMILYPKYNKHYGSDVPQDIALLRLNRTVNFASNVGTVCLPITRELQKMELRGTEAIVTGWGDSGTGRKSDVLLKAEVPVYSRITCRQYYNTGYYRIVPKHFPHGYFTGFDSPPESIQCFKSKPKKIRGTHYNSCSPAGFFGPQGMPGPLWKSLVSRIFKIETSSYSVICAGQEGVDTCQGDSGGPLTVPFFYKNDYRHIQFGITSFGHWVCGTKKPAVYTDVRFYMNWILDRIKP